MLLLFETAAGYALFKVLKEGKVEKADVSMEEGGEGGLRWLHFFAVALCFFLCSKNSPRPLCTFAGPSFGL
jgi:hypothetical protein